MIEKKPALVPTKIENKVIKETSSQDKITKLSEVIQEVPKKKSLPYVLPFFKPTSDYWNFTKKSIYIDKGIQTEIRWIAYLEFVEKGLLPMAKHFGYHLNGKPIQIVDNLCRLTYSLSKDAYASVRFIPDPDGTVEDYEYFCFLFNTDIWDSFWRQWSSLYDFSDDCPFGSKVRYKMHNFLWSFVNIQLSSVTQQVDDDISETELDQIDQEQLKTKKEAEDEYYSHQSKFYS